MAIGVCAQSRRAAARAAPVGFLLVTTSIASTSSIACVSSFVSIVLLTLEFLKDACPRGLNPANTTAPPCAGADRRSACLRDRTGIATRLYSGFDSPMLRSSVSRLCVTSASFVVWGHSAASSVTAAIRPKIAHHVADEFSSKAAQTLNKHVEQPVSDAPRETLSDRPYGMDGTRVRARFDHALASGAVQGPPEQHKKLAESPAISKCCAVAALSVTSPDSAMVGRGRRHVGALPT
jgi:hypothetical protein